MAKTRLFTTTPFLLSQLPQRFSPDLLVMRREAEILFSFLRPQSDKVDSKGEPD